MKKLNFEEGGIRCSNTIFSGGVLNLERPVSVKGSTIVSRKMEIGAFTAIWKNCYLRNVERIGRFCSIAENCYFNASNHPTKALTANSLFYSVQANEWANDSSKALRDLEWKKSVCEKAKINEKPSSSITIGNDVWIGEGVTILNGVHIGDGAIIGAKSVVTKDVEPYSIVVGNPGHAIKKRFDEETISVLLELRWWQYGPDILQGLDLWDLNICKKIGERISTNQIPLYESQFMTIKDLQ